MLRSFFIVECGIARFLCTVRVFELRAASLSPRLPFVSNLVCFAASIAELARGKTGYSIINHSITHLSSLGLFDARERKRLGIEGCQKLPNCHNV